MSVGPVRTVVVIDDDASIRRSLARLLVAEGYRVVDYPSADAFLQQPAIDRASVLVVDVAMPGLDGLELQAAIASQGWILPIVFVTGRGDVPTGVRAMKAGAVDFLTKPFAASDVLDAIGRAVSRAEGERTARAELDVLQARFATLTPREQEVMGQVVKGLLNKQIAGELGAAEKTIKAHRGRVMQKMQVQSVADLVRAAERLRADDR